MATDFMSALRNTSAGSVNRLARIQDRQSRLSGRPLTPSEQAAPYTAMADTASSRLATGKTLQLQEEQQDTQKDQFGQELEFKREDSAQSAALERERLAELARQSEANLAFQRKQMDAQLEAASMARESDKRAQTMQLATMGVGIGLMAVKEWGGDIAAGIGRMFSGGGK